MNFTGFGPSQVPAKEEKQSNRRKLNALAFDAGSQDKGIAASIKELDKVLDSYGIKHVFEEYDGDHINRIAERIGNNLLTFFSENLSFEQPKW